MEHLPILLALLAALPSAANDGFFQGAGDTVRPVSNPALRVVSETLTLNALEQGPCFQTLYRGKAEAPGKDYAAGEFASIAAAPGCPGDGALPNFTPYWQAEAVYQVVALEDAAEVQFGFPAHTWDAEFADEDGLNSIPAPGVAGFATSIDGRAVRGLKLKRLSGLGAAGDKTELGFTWTASFKKGGRHTLKTTYLVGIDVSNRFYSGREYAAGERPWFLDERTGGTRRLIYYLTPLKLWAAPAPERVSIVATLPRAVPMTLAVPVAPKPVCVGERSLFYEFRNAVPEKDLELTVPMTPGAKTLQSAADVAAWQKTLGGPRVEFNCALLARLRRESGPGAVAALAGRACRPTCRRTD